MNLLRVLRALRGKNNIIKQTTHKEDTWRL